MGARKGSGGVKPFLCCIALLSLGAAAESMPYRLMESAGASGKRPYPVTQMQRVDSARQCFYQARAGSRVLFSAGEDVNGTELWVIDPGTGRVSLLKDVMPTSSQSSAYPQNGLDNLVLTHVLERGSLVYFRRQIDPHCGTWYRTDGTTEGTIPVDGLNLGLAVNMMDGSYPIAEVGETIFFFIEDDAHNFQIWKTDFTPAGTGKVTDTVSLGKIVPGFGVHAAGSLIYFAATDYADAYWICKSNGTAAGTAKVAKIATPEDLTSNSYTETLAVGGTLYFRCRDSAHGVELWKTDGTATGTRMVKDIWPGGSNGLMHIQKGTYGPGSNLLYLTAEDGSSGRRLWCSDGTEAGTRAVPDPFSNPRVSSAIHVGQLGSYAYFFIRGEGGGSTSGLMRTNGSTSEKLSDTVLNVSRSMVVGDALLFLDDDFYRNLWKVTNSSPLLVKLSNFTLYNPASPDPVLLGSWIYFWESRNLWRTDGTPEGTSLVTSLTTPDWCTVNGDALYIWSFNHGWKSDGTEAGTVPIESGAAAPENVFSPNPVILGNLGDKAIIAAKDGAGQGALWSTDGTKPGTTLLKNLGVLTAPVVYGNEIHPDCQMFATMGSNLYFSGSDGSSGTTALWKTDGTAAGTVKVASVGGRGAYGMAAAGNTLFVGASSDIGDPCLWKSDGTEAGTVKVSDLSGTHLTAVGSTVYFIQKGYNTTPASLYRSDGTAAGTRKIVDLGDTTKNTSPCLDFLTPFGSSLFFVFDYNNGEFHTPWRDSRPYICTSPTSFPFRLRDTSITGWYNPARAPVMGTNVYFGVWDETHGSELWKSDGTTAKTVLVKDLVPGKGTSLTSGMVYAVSGADMYFAAADEKHGVELWKTDGTEKGTVLVKDIQTLAFPDRGSRCPDVAGALPHHMLTRDDAVYFAAADDATGTELWVTRGTAETTLRLDDMNPGPGSSNPAQLTLAGNRLVYTATDGTDRGTELWAMILPAKSPANPGAVVLGPDSILWTWQDISTEETGFKLWSNSGTGTPTTVLRATLPANTTSWRQDGLSANTAYSFQVVSTGEEGDSLPSATFTAWTSVPEPTGLHFSQVTKNSIQVTVDPVPANITQGQSGLYFVNQTRGLNSGWVQTASGWGCTGLSPNTPYTFIGRARNGAGVETGPAVGAKYTQAVTPAAPAVDNPGVHTLDVSGIRGAGNPSYTLYAVQLAPAVGGNAWVQADGTLGGEAFFQTAGAWGALTVTGLAENTAYAFSAVARNGEGVDSEPGAAGTGTTLDITPPTALITLDDPNPLNADAVRFGVRFDEPVGASLSPARITLAGTLAGTVAVSGTDPDHTVTVTLADPDLDGTVGIVIGAGVADLSGNAYAGGSSGLYTLTHWAGFTQQPVGARRYQSESHLLQVAVNTGGLPTAYQWKRLKADGAVLNGPATAQWQLSVLGTADPGNYWCEVTNGGVTHPSEMVSLSVRSHLRIVHQPRSGEAFFGEAWAFSVDADGGYPPLHYQWRKEQQQDCPGATEEVYLIDPLQPEDAGLYSVEIHDSNTDALESYPVRLTLTQRIPAAGGAALAAMAALLAMAGAGRVGNKVRKRWS